MKQTVETMFFELLKRFDSQLPLLHPLTDMQIESKKLTKLIEAQKQTETELQAEDIKKVSSNALNQFETK